jgi:hypothetical protein
MWRNSILPLVVTWTALGQTVVGFDDEFNPVVYSDRWNVVTDRASVAWSPNSATPPPAQLALRAQQPVVPTSDPALASVTFTGPGSGAGHSGVSQAYEISFNWSLSKQDVSGGTRLEFIYGYSGSPTFLGLVLDQTDPTSGTTTVTLRKGQQFGWLLTTPAMKEDITVTISDFSAVAVPEAGQFVVAPLLLAFCLARRFWVQPSDAGRADVPPSREP